MGDGHAGALPGGPAALAGGQQPAGGQPSRRRERAPGGMRGSPVLGDGPTFSETRGNEDCLQLAAGAPRMQQPTPSPALPEPGQAGGRRMALHPSAIRAGPGWAGTADGPSWGRWRHGVEPCQGAVCMPIGRCRQPEEGDASLTAGQKSVRVVGGAPWRRASQGVHSRRHLPTRQEPCAAHARHVRPGGGAGPGMAQGPCPPSGAASHCEAARTCVRARGTRSREGAHRGGGSLRAPVPTHGI